MKQLIGVCGLDCESCDARIATLNDDDALREKTAQYWGQLNQVEMTKEMINCVGCRVDGPKTAYCTSMCKMRACATEKGYETCGDCPIFEECDTLGSFLAHNPEVLDNLRQ